MKRMMFLTVVLIAAGCQRDGTAPAAKDAVPVAQAGASAEKASVIKPERRTVKRVIEQPGEVRADEQTPIHAKIAGFVAKVNKDIGDPVAENEVLAEVSVPELDEEWSQKKALVVQADAEAEQARQSLLAAIANLATADSQVKEAEAGRLRAQANFDRWDKEYKRVAELVKSKVIDEQTRDEAFNQYEAAAAIRTEVEAKVKSAIASRDESAAKRGKAEADVKAAEAHQKVARADERRLAALVEYKYLRAPFKGVVTLRQVDKGHFLQSAGGKSEPLFVVMKTDPVRVAVDVPEVDAVFIAGKERATVRGQALKGQEFPGEVKRFAWALDPRSRTLRTEIDLPNADRKLRPGMYVSTAITVEHKDVLTLPLSAIVTQGEQSYCYRVEQGKAVRTRLQLGLRDKDVVEVTKKQSGQQSTWEELSGTEEIVRDASSATDGQVVK
jgi:multidrug efflux pump subunit AcrA (membrane-fusion protein)